MRPAIKNRLVPLAIRDYFELVKRALLVEQDIVDTNQIQEQMGIEKLNKKWEKVPRRGLNISSKGNKASSMRDILRSMLKVSRVLRRRQLLEYVIVMGQKIIYGGLAH